jgi:hypothetical protein
MSEQPEPGLESLAMEMDKHLSSASASFGEQAFGVGCSVSVVPLGIVLLLAYILGARNWISLGLVALGGLILAVAFAAFVAYRARSNALQRIYQAEVAPQIEQYLAEHRLERTQFAQQVAALLPESAPLRRAWPKSNQPQIQADKR